MVDCTSIVEALIIPRSARIIIEVPPRNGSISFMMKSRLLSTSFSRVVDGAKEFLEF